MNRRAEQTWFRMTGEAPSMDEHRIAQELYQSGYSDGAEDARRETVHVLLNAVDPGHRHFDPKNEDAAEIVKRHVAELTRERDIALAKAALYKAEHHSGYYYEEGPTVEEQAAIDEAEARLRELGVDPSELDGQ